MSSRINYPSPFIAFCLFTSFLFCSCSRHDGRFHLEGHFKNLNQGEFYLYSQEQGTKDTIAVNDGSFFYERELTDTVTYVLLFPNYSEIPVFARANAEVKMEGDVTHLRETTVTGTEENDAMTAFRVKTAEMTPSDVQKAAAKFIEEHPTSPVGAYLLRRHFIEAALPDYQQALQLCGLLHKAQPQNPHLARLYTLLEGLQNDKSDGPLPTFSTVDTKGDTITNKQLQSEANVILLWASWNYESQAVVRQVASLVKSHPKKISVMSITLDAAPNESTKFLERDSISWPNVCDSLLWQSPLLAQLGISSLPANIVTNKQGSIVARNLTSTELKTKIESLVGEN